METPARIPVTHVGSLPRPPELVALIASAERGDAVDAAALEQAIDTAVRDAVRRQATGGIDIVSDGEQGRPSYATYIKDRLTGFSGSSPPLAGADLEEFPRFFAAFRARRAGSMRLARPCCTGAVRRRDGTPLARELGRLRAALDAQGLAHGFVNAASPGVVTVFHENRHYASRDAYLADVADAMRDEYRAVIAAGFDLQVDCPDLAMGRHLAFKSASEGEFLAHACRQVEALNAALAGLPGERVRLHLCWGNYEGPHHRDIPLDAIFEVVMRVKARILLFEAANPRHAHEWRVFAERRHEIPDDMVLAPGLVSPTSAYIEHPELVAERLQRFADIVGRDRVVAAADCGFAPFAGDAQADADLCYAKLAALAEGARLASRRLFGG